MNSLHVGMQLMRCFYGSFINQNGEFIAHKYSNTYFNLATCENELDVKCKVLEWLSRPASKGMPYSTEKRNETFRQFMRDGINEYLGTAFSESDFHKIYSYLGNRCNHDKTLRFIESGYDMGVITNGGEDDV